jgi:formyltetrahydrofolate synthetase
MLQLYSPVTYDSEGAGRASLATVLLEAFFYMARVKISLLREPAAGPAQALKVSARSVRKYRVY